MVPDFSFTTSQFWLVAIACGAIGVVLKAIPQIPSGVIPAVNLVIGAVALPLLYGATWSWQDVLCGVIAASVATFAYELFSNTLEGIKSAALGSSSSSKDKKDDR